MKWHDVFETEFPRISNPAAWTEELAETMHNAPSNDEIVKAIRMLAMDAKCPEFPKARHLRAFIYKIRDKGNITQLNEGCQNCNQSGWILYTRPSGSDGMVPCLCPKGKALLHTTYDQSLHADLIKGATWATQQVDKVRADAEAQGKAEKEAGRTVLDSFSDLRGAMRDNIKGLQEGSGGAG